MHHITLIMQPDLDVDCKPFQRYVTESVTYFEHAVASDEITESYKCSTFSVFFVVAYLLKW